MFDFKFHTTFLCCLTVLVVQSADSQGCCKGYELSKVTELRHAGVDRLNGYS